MAAVRRGAAALVARLRAALPSRFAFPYRVELKAGKKYAWCSCGHSRAQVCGCGMGPAWVGGGPAVFFSQHRGPFLLRSRSATARTARWLRTELRCASRRRRTAKCGCAAANGPAPPPGATAATSGCGWRGEETDAEPHCWALTHPPVTARCRAPHRDAAPALCGSRGVRDGMGAWH